jgi:hypothetical protein
MKNKKYAGDIIIYYNIILLVLVLVLGEIHGKMNFFGIKFGWLNFSENTIQCVGIVSPPKYFLKRPSNLVFVL